MRKLKVIMSLLLSSSMLLSAVGCSKSGGDKAVSNDSKEQVVIKVMDWSDSSKTRREEFHKKFTTEHPNIKIEYTQLTADQYNNTILTATKSDNAPDLFPVPGTIKLSNAVKEGWYQPMDAYIDAAFKEKFVEGTFMEGTNVIGGKVYSVPEALSVATTLVYYNKKLFKEAGLDPENPPKTWSQFREAAQKITAAGKGKYYGVIEGGKQVNRWGYAARDFASLAGAGLNGSNPTSLVTGTPSFDSTAVKDTFAFFKGLAEDKSYHPSTMNLSAPEARALFAQGQAAFIIQGAWCIGTWEKESPELDFGVMAPPVPDNGRKGSIAMFTPGPWMGLSAKTKHPKEAMEYLKALYGDFYQGNVVADGTQFSPIKGINEKYLKGKNIVKYYNLNTDMARVVPDPAVRNPEMTKVYDEIKEIHPNIGELLQGVVAGTVKDTEGKLKEMTQKSDVEWKRAIKAAQDKKATVDAKDFIFSNWDPMKNYSIPDYKSLK